MVLQQFLDCQITSLFRFLDASDVLSKTKHAFVELALCFGSVNLVQDQINFVGYAHTRVFSFKIL